MLCETGFGQICSGTINTVWKDDFGSGTAQISTQLYPGITNGYTNQNNGVEPGNYTIVNRFDFFSSWHVIPQDHTPTDSNGYFLVIDGNNDVPIFYDVLVYNICPFTQYSFSTAAMNVDKPEFPSDQTFTFIISDTLGNQLATWSSPALPALDSPVWKPMGFSFSSGNNTKLRLQVQFNQTGFNDFAFDDFQFSVCGPLLDINTPVTGNTCTDSIPLFSVLGSGYANPVYLWKKKNALGIFETIPGANAVNYVDRLPGDSNFYSLLVGDGSLSCPIIASKQVNLSAIKKTTVFKTICRGLVIEGYDKTGIYIDTLKTVSGCDSIRTLNLSVVSCTDGIINNYTPVYSINPCNNTLTSGDNIDFNPGDTVLLIQMKGATIDSNNNEGFGYIYGYNNAGNFEFNIIKSKSTNVIEFKNKLLYQYNPLLGRVQLIRVPYFESFISTDTLTCAPWDGTKGGVLVINVANTLTLNAPIDVSRKGFRGGDIGTGFGCNNAVWAAPSGIGGTKGEGIADYFTGSEAGGARLANGGGGAFSANSGAGGGGNFGVGGLGGIEYNGCNTNLQSIGGENLDYSNVNKIYLGGAGGGGQQDNGLLVLPGGNGGGIVIIKAPTINGNNQKISANGENITTVIRDEGGTGGGAGGSILLITDNYLSQLNIEAKGGSGSSNFNQKYPTRCHGPGGGGGGGFAGSSTPLPAQVNYSLQGGTAGIILNPSSSCYNTTHGATEGGAGAAKFGFTFPFSEAPFVKNIDAVIIKDSLINCNTFKFDGDAIVNTSAIQNWQWTFDDGSNANTQITTHTYSDTGKYTVKLVVTDINSCADSVSKIIRSSGVNYDFTFNQDICNPLQVTFKINNAALSGPSWSMGDGTIINNNASPIYQYADTGTYLIKLAIQNSSCIDTIRKKISINFSNHNIILTPDTTICKGFEKLLRSNIDSTVDFCWSPASFLNNNTFANPTTNTTVPITYRLTGIVTENNLVVNGNFSSGNSSFSSGYTISNTSPAIESDGQYAIAATAFNAVPAALNCTDHTDGAGNMLLVRSNNEPNIPVWQQTIPVEPNTNYVLSTWIQSLQSPNNTQLQFAINGIAMGDTISTAAATCQWKKHWIIWNSGNNTIATIAIVNKNKLTGGDYYALDDIAFSKYFIRKDSVFINVQQVAVTANTDSSICRGEKIQLLATGAATYEWQPANSLSDSSIANPLASPVNKTNYIVKGTSTAGCTAYDTVAISIKQSPVVVKSNDSIICKNSSIQLNVSGGTSYSWVPAVTLSSNNIANPMATPTSSTTYFVTTSDAALTCTSIDSIKISIRPVTVFTISPSDSVCINSTVQLTTTGGNKFTWEPANLLNNPTIANPITTAVTTTIFKVNIKDSVCNDSALLSTTIYSIALPKLTVSKSNNIDCVDVQASLAVTGANKYLWTAATKPLYLSDSSIATPIAFPSITKKYFVTGIDTFTTCSNKDSITVLVTIGGNPLVFIPNAFSPNGDGINDCFKIKPQGRLNYFKLAIFNRLGQRVFYTTDVNQCWDGTYNGQLQNTGNFVYYLTTKDACRENAKSGNLLLIR